MEKKSLYLTATDQGGNLLLFSSFLELARLSAPYN